MASSSPLRALPSLPHRRLFVPNPPLLLPPRSTPSLPHAKTLLSRSKQGLCFSGAEWPKSTSSEETTATVAVSNKFGNDEAPEKIEKSSYGGGFGEESSPNMGDGEENPSSDFLDQLNLKLDMGDTSSILIYGTTALVALWISSAIISAIDSLPVFPKVMEIVGLGFTIWFSSRYLIFKSNRDELFAKIDELKQQVFGTDDK
ncbi:Protein CURVATURE THYLAKOID 1D, chloroplastic [Ananas comosus]|uniref:Protein CURVATURE THYLAKOID 1D, chloroplastic n=1 Tax=Ananas comosus TaxID=4615 RepID=A0A199W7U4_ANACO|nr:Protein CURVATURE THYLAKOID 1D, chloroplastic [Ananas comosus]